MHEPADRDSRHEEIGTETPPVKIEYFTPASEVRYAGFWIRACALTIDLVVLAVPAIMIGLFCNFFLERWRPPDYFSRRGEGLAQLGAIFCLWIYFAGMESSSYRATIGKQMVGVVVTDEGGNPLTFGHASARLVSKLLSILPFYLGFVVAAFTSQKQAVHDLVARTLVVYDSDKAS